MEEYKIETICNECSWCFHKYSGFGESFVKCILCKSPMVTTRDCITGDRDYPFCNIINKNGNCIHYKKRISWLKRLWRFITNVVSECPRKTRGWIMRDITFCSKCKWENCGACLCPTNLPAPNYVTGKRQHHSCSSINLTGNCRTYEKRIFWLKRLWSLIKPRVHTGRHDHWGVR